MEKQHFTCTCRGGGRIDGHVCEDCNGTGVMIRRRWDQHHGRAFWAVIIGLGIVVAWFWATYLK